MLHAASSVLPGPRASRRTRVAIRELGAPAIAAILWCSFIATERLLADAAPADELTEIEVNVPRLMPPLSSSRAREEPMEEIEVRGRKPLSAWRAELEAAMDNVYFVFNEINSHDDFDIHCKREARTGTRITQRVCRPNFYNEATAESAQAYLRGEDPQAAMARAHYMQLLLEEEMGRLVREDVRLLRAMQDYLDLQRDYEDARRERFDRGR